jgi:hypothetical protein
MDLCDHQHQQILSLYRQPTGTEYVWASLLPIRIGAYVPAPEPRETCGLFLATVQVNFMEHRRCSRMDTIHNPLNLSEYRDTFPLQKTVRSRKLILKPNDTEVGLRHLTTVSTIDLSAKDQRKLLHVLKYVAIRTYERI